MLASLCNWDAVKLLQSKLSQDLDRLLAFSCCKNLEQEAAAADRGKTALWLELDPQAPVPAKHVTRLPGWFCLTSGLWLGEQSRCAHSQAL